MADARTGAGVVGAATEPQVTVKVTSMEELLDFIVHCYPVHGVII